MSSRVPVTVRRMRRDEAAVVGALTLAAYDRYGTIEGDYRDFLADPLRRIDRCTALLVATVPTTVASDTPDTPDTPDTEDAGDAEHADDAEDAGERVVGTVTYVEPDDPEWEDRPQRHGDAGFRVLAVDPAHEGRGVGSALVDACFDLAREAGAHRMLITSMSWMDRAHELYVRRYGFVRRPDLDVRFPSGTGVILARDLTDHAEERFPPPGPVPDPPPWYEDVWTS